MKPIFEYPTANMDLSQDKGRWIILLLIFMTTVGSLFAYDTVGVLQEKLEKTLNVDEFGVNMFYYATIIPNMFLPFISGFIIDRLGIRSTLVGFSFLVALGQLIVCVGIEHTSFYLTLAGRFIFGLGYQSQYVAKTVMISRWANKNDLSFALTISIFLSRVGTSFNMLASPSIASIFGLAAPFHLGFLLTFTQVILALVIIFADKKAQEGKGDERFFAFENSIQLEDSYTFVKPFYILVIGCALSSGIFSAFSIEGAGILSKRFSWHKEEAETIMNLVLIISTVGLPIFALMADKIAKKLYIMPLYTLIFVAAAIDLALKPDAAPEKAEYSVLINLAFFALLYSSSTAISWSCIPLVTGSNKMGLASGITLSMIEIFLFVLPIFCGLVKNFTSNIGHGYFYTTLCYAGFGIVVFGLMIWLIIEDKKIDRVLNRKTKNEEKKPVTELEMSIDKKFMQFENEEGLA